MSEDQIGTMKNAEPNGLENVAAMMGTTVDSGEETEVETPALREGAALQVLAGGEDAETELEADFFEDEDEYFGKTTKGYTAKVKIGPMVFFIVEAPPEVLAAYNEANKKTTAELKAVDRDGKALEEAGGQPDADLMAELEERANAATAKMIEANTKLIEATVRDWHNPQWPRKRPCTTQSRAKLSPSRKAELANLIVQKTKTGHASSDRFLRS